MNENVKIILFFSIALVAVVGIAAIFIQGNSVSYEEFTLVANLKGSIYESGEMISLFGTCEDADRNSINATGLLTAYYPNGTIMFQDTPMSQFELGKYLYSAPMSSVQGTYLTAFECQYFGESAWAYGEWQNPYWVARLATIQNLTENFDVNLTPIEFLLNDSFNITFNYLEQINTTINNYTGFELIGNSSAILIGIAKTVGACKDCNLTYIAYYREPIKFYNNWHLYAKVYNEYGRDVTEVVNCNVTTNFWGTENMIYQSGNTYYTDDIGDDISNSIPKKCPNNEKTKAGDIVEPLCPRLYYGHKIDQRGTLAFNVTCDWLFQE